MSNHSGSYLLNYAIEVFKEEQVFDVIKRDKAQRIILNIINYACDKYDCNSGEILDGHAEFFEICGYCLTVRDNVKEGLCSSCKNKLEEDS